MVPPQRFWIAVLVAAMAAGGVARSQPATLLRIGALNIEWLGAPGNRSGPAKNVAQKPRDLADYVKASGVSILALEEIGDDDGVDDRWSNRTLDKAFALLNANGQGRWRYRLFPKHTEAGEPATQLTGLAWNESAVTPARCPSGAPDEYRLELVVPPGTAAGAPGSLVFERWATAMKFSAGQGQTDLVVIPVHLKSNRAAFPGQDTAAQRDLEAEMLLAALPQVRARFGDEGDVVVLGDTNVLDKNEEAVAAFRAARFVDLNSADLPTYVSGQFQNPFDRAFVPDAAGNPQAQEFAQAGFDVFRHPALSAAQYRKLISDHRMIRLTVAILADDD